jgi:hypothetical protein
VWGWGPPEKEKKRLRDLLDAITLLKRNALHETDVIGAYHVRRVAPLMARALPLYRMMPSVSLTGWCLPRRCFATARSHSTLKRQRRSPTSCS